MKKKMDTVVKFASGTQNEAGRNLVVMMEDYAKHYLKEKDTNGNFKSDVSLEDKAKCINKVYFEYLTKSDVNKIINFQQISPRLSDGTLTNEDRLNIEKFAGFTNTKEFAQMADKVMLNAVYPYVFNEEFFGGLCQMHFTGYGDSLVFDIENNELYDVSEFGRRQRNTKTQSRDHGKASITTKQYGITTITNLPEILLGESMRAEDIMVSALSMRKKVYDLVMAEFIAKTNAVTATQLVLSGYDEKEWLKRQKVVKAYSGNANPVQFGDIIALKTLLPEAQNVRIDLRDAYNTSLGYLDRWNGYNVMAFDSVASYDGAYGLTGLPEDRIYSIAGGKKIIHVGLGETYIRSEGAFDNNNLSIKATMSQEIGVKLVTNDVVAVLKL